MPYKDPEKSKANKREWVERNRKKYLAYQQEYQKKYREKHGEKLRKTSREWAAADPNRAHRASRNSYLKRNFGITADQYDHLLKKQSGVCACCGREPKNNALDRYGRPRMLAVDHDHDTGALRGLLCHSCNVGIGQLGDSISGLMRAVAYLERAASNRNLPTDLLEVTE
jgi:hypothetical protein